VRLFCCARFSGVCLAQARTNPNHGLVGGLLFAEAMFSVEKDRDPQITPIPQIFEFKSARARPWTRCRAMRRALLRGLGGFVHDVRFETTQSDRGRSKCQHDFTQERHRVQGCALALLRRCAPYSKMRTLFEKCASWKTPRIPSKMRTSFQGAHGKLRTFERRTGAGRERCGLELSRGGVVANLFRYNCRQSSALRADFFTSEPARF
jgi:hypothetical protein